MWNGLKSTRCGTWLHSSAPCYARAMARAGSVTLAVMWLIGGCAVTPLQRPDVDRFEAQVVLPATAEPLENYARFYPPLRSYRLDDLPFTTIDEDALPFNMGHNSEAGPPEPESPTLGVVVLVLRSTGSEVRKGRHLVPLTDVPQVFHGGCGVVNATFDPRSGETLSIWCNVPTL